VALKTGNICAGETTVLVDLTFQQTFTGIHDRHVVAPRDAKLNGQRLAAHAKRLRR
jgi:hypothetical protein